MDCSMTSSVLSANYNTVLFEFGVILVTSKLFYALLRNVYQPRVFSDLLLGIILAQFRVLSITNAINLVFGKIGGFIFAPPYLFALGVEMDPFSLLESPTADAVVAYAGILSTCVVVTLCHSAITSTSPTHTGIVHERSLRAFLGLAAALANTASPVLTRMATVVGHQDCRTFVMKSELLHLTDGSAAVQCCAVLSQRCKELQAHCSMQHAAEHQQPA